MRNGIQEKPCVDMGFSQFELSKITLKNLNKFKLSPTAKLVLLSLVDHYNPNKKDFYPAQQTMADNLGVNVSSVKRAIKELAQQGVIVYETKKVNRYKLTNKFFTQSGAKKFSENKLPPNTVQNETSNSGNLHHKQIKEKINNKTNFSKTSSFNEYKNRKYHHNTQQTGIKYQKYTPEKIDRGSPMDYTKEQAIEYLNNLPSFLKRSNMAENLRKKWNL